MCFIKKSYSMKSRLLSTTMHETVKVVRSGLNSVQRPGSEVHEGAVDASVLRKASARKLVGSVFCLMGCAFFGDKCEMELREQEQLCQ